MASRKKQTAIRQLWVIFDTNAIYTGSASYLLRKEVVDTINENSAHPDLAIRWILPAIVRHERQYQMIRQARGFLPTVEKLERLLGHNLNIPPDILDLRVGEAVQRSIETLKLEVAELDAGDLDWQRLILDAAYRRPPFEPGEREKGFRDAIVLETFAQLVAKAPSNPKSCRLALVTGDKLLADAAELRSANTSNVRLFGTIEELRGLINTLVSEVDEDFVKQLMPQASKLFFAVGGQDTLYNAEEISKQINARIKADIGQLPNGAEKYEVLKYLVAPPQFVGKDKQQIRWSSRVEVKLGALKKASAVAKATPIDVFTPIHFNVDSTNIDAALLQNANAFDVSSYFNKNAGSFFSPPPKFQTVSSGRASYDVLWSTTINTAHKLTRPQVASLDFIEVAWGTD